MLLLIGERVLISFILREDQITDDFMTTYVSFYSSQGRQTSFPDHNAGLIDHLLESVSNLATLEVSMSPVQKRIKFQISLAVSFGCLGFFHRWKPSTSTT